jgi:tetratricopeptide (TPR) repeat protein
VAISCDAVGQSKRAIEHYRIAITLELSAPQPDYTNIAYSYESMGNILYYCFKKYDEAMNCYEHSLELMLVYLPATHPDISSVYDSMAEIYEKQNELDKALDILYKSLDTTQKRPESEPRELANTYGRIAEIYNKQKKFEEAAIMFNKCHELKAAHPSSVDFQLDNIDIDAVFAKLFRPDNDS